MYRRGHKTDAPCVPSVSDAATHVSRPTTKRGRVYSGHLPQAHAPASGSVGRPPSFNPRVQEGVWSSTSTARSHLAPHALPRRRQLNPSHEFLRGSDKSKGKFTLDAPSAAALGACPGSPGSAYTFQCSKRGSTGFTGSRCRTQTSSYRTTTIWIRSGYRCRGHSRRMPRIFSGCGSSSRRSSVGCRHTRRALPVGRCGLS